MSVSRVWVAMALRTDQGDIRPRARRWLVMVGSPPVGTGAWGVGVRSLGSPGCGLKTVGCGRGNSLRGISMRVGEVGPPYVDEAGDSAEALQE